MGWGCPLQLQQGSPPRQHLRPKFRQGLQAPTRPKQPLEAARLHRETAAALEVCTVASHLLASVYDRIVMLNDEAAGRYKVSVTQLQIDACLQHTSLHTDPGPSGTAVVEGLV